MTKMTGTDSSQQAPKMKGETRMGVGGGGGGRRRKKKKKAKARTFKYISMGM